MFDLLERSRFGGRPIHYFVFSLQAKSWRYCTADRDMVVDGQTYLAASIERSEIKLTTERAKDKITITMAYARDPGAAVLPSTQPLGDLWTPYIPSDTVYVTCLAGHVGDAAQPSVEWMGQVVQPKYTDSTLELTCTPTGDTDIAKNQGPRWQRGCWKTLYSTGLRGCNLIAEPSVVTGTLSAVSGSTITSSAFSDQPRSYVGGTVRWDDAGTPRVAHITARSGTTLTLDDVTGLSVGSTVTATTSSLLVSAALASVDGLSVAAAEFAASAYSLAGGSLSWTRADGIIERRSIMRHEGDTLTLLYGAADLAAGLAVTAKPGCAHTWAACAAFGNTVNFGGAAYKPVKNPLDGVSMSWG